VLYPTDNALVRTSVANLKRQKNRNEGEEGHEEEEYDETQPHTWKGRKRFHQFSRFSVEIRMQIWKFATPDPRDVDGGTVIFHLDFDLSNAKAILLSPKEILSKWDVISHIPHMWNQHRRDRFEHDWRARLRQLEKAFWSCPCKLCTALPYEFSCWSIPFEYVLDLMHTCREARTAARTVYALTVMSALPNDFLPWKPDNILYFAPTHHWMLMTYFLNRPWTASNPLSDQIRRIAIHLVHEAHSGYLTDPLSEGFSGLRYNRDRVRDGNIIRKSFLETLHGLQSINGVLDPGIVSVRDTGSLALYEPMDVPVQRLRHKRPFEIVQIIEKELALHTTGNPPREVIEFELSVLVWKKPKTKTKWE
jgi:hypothetical protein